MKHFFYCMTLFVLSLTCTACFNSDEYDAASPSLIRLETFSGQAEANGADGVTIRAKLSGEAAKDRRTIVFKTTRGFFTQSKRDSLAVTAGDNFLGEAELVSITPGEAKVTLSARGVHSTDTAAIVFRQAYPTKITVSVDSVAISDRPGNEITITASLKSGNGIPSTGHKVDFQVFDGTTMVGAFLNGSNSATTDANGVSRIRYSPIGASPQRFLTITATTNTVNDIPLPAATTRIYLYHR